jgi:hypothetical protein
MCANSFRNEFVKLYLRFFHEEQVAELAIAVVDVSLAVGAGTLTPVTPGGFAGLRTLGASLLPRDPE